MTNKFEMNAVTTYTIAYHSAGTTDEFEASAPIYHGLSAKTDAGAIRQTKKFLSALPDRPEIVHLQFRTNSGAHGCINRYGNVTYGVF